MFPDLQMIGTVELLSTVSIHSRSPVNLKRCISTRCEEVRKGPKCSSRLIERPLEASVTKRKLRCSATLASRRRTALARQRVLDLQARGIAIAREQRDTLQANVPRCAEATICADRRARKRAHATRNTPRSSRMPERPHRRLAHNGSPVRVPTISTPDTGSTAPR